MSRIATIRVKLKDNSYPILLGEGLLDEIHPFLETLRPKPNRIALVTDSNVDALYGDRAIRSLTRFHAHVARIEIAPGENSKSLQGLHDLYETFTDAGIDRNSLVVALGGGVVGDLAGFAAATYLRGVRFLQIPTSLLAQVDSSVGGKTGINLSWGKNLVGAFHQPVGVLIDPELLKSLEKRQLKNGLAEVIKCAAIADRTLFDLLDRKREEILSSDPKLLLKIIRRSVQIKAAIVQRDEKESGPRMLLNFGHTVGHAIEAAKNYEEILHGEAVSIGMAAAGILSAELNYCPGLDRDRLHKLLGDYKLPTQLPQETEIEEVLDFMSKDKKRQDKNLRFVLLQRIGKAKIVDRVDPAAIRKVLAILR